MKYTNNISMGLNGSFNMHGCMTVKVVVKVREYDQLLSAILFTDGIGVCGFAVLFPGLKSMTSGRAYNTIIFTVCGLFRFILK